MQRHSTGWRWSTAEKPLADRWNVHLRTVHGESALHEQSRGPGRYGLGSETMPVHMRPGHTAEEGTGADVRRSIGDVGYRDSTVANELSPVDGRNEVGQRLRAGALG